jgi:glycosyl transferase family 25
MCDYIDKIIYINLDNRLDKKEVIENELDNFSLKYERYRAIFQPYNGVGCAKSHLEVLKIAKNNKYKNILILEDDFKFIVSKEVFYNNLSLLFETPVDFDVCMLSYSINKGEVSEIYPFLIKATDVQTASGYIVNEKMYDRLIELYEYSVPLLEQTGQHWIFTNDQIWKQLQPTSDWYCFKERLGLQRPGINDNGPGGFTDYKC